MGRLEEAQTSVILDILIDLTQKKWWEGRADSVRKKKIGPHRRDRRGMRCALADLQDGRVFFKRLWRAWGAVLWRHGISG